MPWVVRSGDYQFLLVKAKFDNDIFAKVSIIVGGEDEFLGTDSRAY